MKKEEKSDLRVKNWQEPINWYEPDEIRVKYLDIPGIPQRIWVTEEFYKTYKSDFWRLWKEKIMNARCRIKSEKGNFWKRCEVDCSAYTHSKYGNDFSPDKIALNYKIEFNYIRICIVNDLCVKKKKNERKSIKIYVTKIINFIFIIINILNLLSRIIKTIQFIIKYWF